MPQAASSRPLQADGVDAFFAAVLGATAGALAAGAGVAGAGVAAGAAFGAGCDGASWAEADAIMNSDAATADAPIPSTDLSFTGSHLPWC